MKANVAHQVKEGSRIVYDDGRPGHTSAHATVLRVDSAGMLVQFDDRADTTCILFSDRMWMDSIEVVSKR